MKAAIFKSIGLALELGQMADPIPGSDQVLLRIERCGVCGSDLHMTSDPVFCLPSGAILGHEMAGVVVDKGADVSRLQIGDRVSVLPISSCGSCKFCLAGDPAWCKSMVLGGGGYAEMLAVDERQCLRLPASLTSSDGALVEPLAVGRHGAVIAGSCKDARVLIVGAGPIGLATAFWARLLGAKEVVVTASSRQREEIALNIGADRFLDPEIASDSSAVAAELGWEPDIVFECVGKAGLIAQCIDLVKPRGTVVVLGLCTGKDSFDPFKAISKEVRIQMAAFYGMTDFEESARALDRGLVEPRSMITSHISLDQLPTTFEMLRGRTAECKVMVSSSGS